MSKLAIKLVVKDYDHVTPLACGDVTAEGIDLTLDLQSSMSKFYTDLSFQAGEMSLSQYIIRTTQGERGFVGLPLFPTRAFRHRCFLVLRNSALKELTDLEGKRVGTNGWPDTGNTWSRAALREAGVDIKQIHWSLGPVDDPTYDSLGNRPKLTLPANVQLTQPGQTLKAMLLAGELDALMVPYPPQGFYEPDSPIVRLIPDYRRAEQAYARRVGFYPAHHIIALRRELFEKEPWVAVSLYRAFEQSRLQWQQSRLHHAETSPWLLADLEEAMRMFGYDWQPDGVEPNRAMLKTLCREEFEQGLIDKPRDASTVFAEFEQVMAESGGTG